MAKRIRETFEIEKADGGWRRVELVGRFAWTLRQLMQAGPTGLTTLDKPAPRWSEYVRSLRHDHRINIETVRERHDGPFPGGHGRYILRAAVRPADAREAT